MLQPRDSLGLSVRMVEIEQFFLSSICIDQFSIWNGEKLAWGGGEGHKA